MRYMTEEEFEKSKKFIEKIDRKIEKREKIKSTLRSGFHTMFYTPLTIAFHAVAFILRGIGCIASLGLPIGFYYTYKSICSFVNGTPLKEIESIEMAIVLIVFPFIVYGIATFTEWIGDYFENHNY